MEKVMINDPSLNDLSNAEVDRVTVSSQIMENIELVNQLRQEMAFLLHEKGLMAGRRVLEYTDFNNPDRIYEEALSERGIMEIVEFLGENPEAQEYVQQMMEMRSA